MAFRTFNGIPDPLIYAALIPAREDLGLPGFDLLMPQKEFTVGRGEHNDICIRGRHISNEQCKLVWDSEKKVMLVQWLPTTNGTWIKNSRHECHRLKQGESFHLYGDISFGPAVSRYGKGPGRDDYLYTFRVYGEHRMQEHLQPEELVERKKARARFKTAHFDKATATRRCVVQYRTSSDRPPELASAERQATPPFVPPPALGDDFKPSGNVGHFEPRDKADGHDWADPDIVWRAVVPVNPNTEPVFPDDMELWSHHYGLPVGLHPDYQTFSGTPYDDTFTEIDQRRQERAERYLTWKRSAEYSAMVRLACEETGQKYTTPTPSPSPAPELDLEQSLRPGRSRFTLSASDVPLTPIPSSHAKVREPSPSDCRSPDSTSHVESAAAHVEDATHVGPRKRKRALDDAPTPKRRQLRAPTSGTGPRTRSARAQSHADSLVASKPTRKSKAFRAKQAPDVLPRRSTRLMDKPPVRYKY
ncbi:unnamed protein product [Peniophora sp. CBMAI 1063]|nr:unnamed protein product [Peniophora sp. CBMAI 1063]